MRPSQKKLRSIFHYSPRTGELKWKVKYSRKVVIGRLAGGLNVAGYVVVGIDGKIYYAHQLIWMWMTGEWPKRVDHRDNIKTNNKWRNLRIATPQQNGLNAKRATTNTSGYKGVSFHKGAGKWIAQITLNGVHTYLGIFDNPSTAHDAYMAAATAAHPSFARAS